MPTLLELVLLTATGTDAELPLQMIRSLLVRIRYSFFSDGEISFVIFMTKQKRLRIEQSLKSNSLISTGTVPFPLAKIQHIVIWCMRLRVCATGVSTVLWLGSALLRFAVGSDDEWLTDRANEWVCLDDWFVYVFKCLLVLPLQNNVVKILKGKLALMLLGMGAWCDVGLLLEYNQFRWIDFSSTRFFSRANGTCCLFLSLQAISCCRCCCYCCCCSRFHRTSSQFIRWANKCMRQHHISSYWFSHSVLFFHCFCLDKCSILSQMLRANFAQI